MALDTRYQVFVSSTIHDLIDARKAVSDALLKVGCFPAGMELFPAADRQQFDHIKNVIDDSDYYLIISAGRYGSIDKETGTSYTELEYDYAVVTGKPIIRLLHANPFDDLPGRFLEKSARGKKKLQAFRDKMSEARLVNYWQKSEELSAMTILSLQQVISDFPAEGWVRGSSRFVDKFARENEELKIRLFDTAQNSSFDPVGLMETLAPNVVNFYCRECGWERDASTCASIAGFMYTILQWSGATLDEGSYAASDFLMTEDVVGKKGLDFAYATQPFVDDGLLRVEDDKHLITEFFVSIAHRLNFICIMKFEAQVRGYWKHLPRE